DREVQTPPLVSFETDCTYRGAAGRVAFRRQIPDSSPLARTAGCRCRHRRTLATRFAVEVCGRFPVPDYLGLRHCGAAGDSSWIGHWMVQAVGNGVKSTDTDLPSNFAAGMDSHIHSLVRRG